MSDAAIPACLFSVSALSVLAFKDPGAPTYKGRPLLWWQSRYPDMQVMSYPEARKALDAAMLGVPVPVTAHSYVKALGATPPAERTAGKFRCAEMVSDTLSRAFFEAGGRHFMRLLPTAMALTGQAADEATKMAASMNKLQAASPKDVLLGMESSDSLHAHAARWIAALRFGSTDMAAISSLVDKAAGDSDFVRQINFRRLSERYESDAERLCHVEFVRDFAMFRVRASLGALGPIVMARVPFGRGKPRGDGFVFPDGSAVVAPSDHTGEVTELHILPAGSLPFRLKMPPGEYRETVRLIGELNVQTAAVDPLLDSPGLRDACEVGVPPWEFVRQENVLPFDCTVFDQDDAEDALRLVSRPHRGYINRLHSDSPSLRADAQQVTDQFGTDIVISGGIPRWQSNNQIPPADVLALWHATGKPFRYAASMLALERETARFLAEYRRNYTGPSDEDRAEARAAMGEGADVVNVLTGDRWNTGASPSMRG